MFSAFVAAIDVGIGCVGDYLQANSKGGETKIFDDLVMRDKHDVLILGSSRARHHYDTPFLSNMLGLDVYNAGYDGNGVVLAYGIFEMVLERYVPKLIIFDVEPDFDINVYASDNNNKRYINNLKPYYRNKAIAQVINQVSIEESYKVHSGMIRYNTVIINKLKDKFRSGADNTKGFMPILGKYVGEPAKREGAAPEADALKIDFLERLILLAQSNNISIIFAASPKYGMVSVSDLQPAVDICKRYNVPFLDFYQNEDFMNHKEWFKEPMHLNDVGARKFSQELVKSLVQGSIIN